MTQTERTQEEYWHRAQLLLSRYRRETGASMSPDATAAEFDYFINWFRDHLRTLRRSTMRGYRAAVVFYLKSTGVTDYAARIKALHVESSVPKNLRRTSRKKAKKLLPKDYKRLKALVLAHNPSFLNVAMVWLYVILITGMRPCETATARLKGGKLLIRNAKHTNGRGNGHQRELLLEGFADWEFRVLKEFLNRIQRWDYEVIYAKARGALYRANRMLWPRRQWQLVTLYSARHQCVADMKRNEFGLAELAASCGHVSDATAQRHYGRRSAGRGRTRFRPSPANVATVRVTGKPAPAGPTPTM